MEDKTKLLEETAINTFESVFGEIPKAMVKAPGRVNLIGEYTDFNKGFVLPMAIDRYVILALRKRDDRQVKVYSIDFEEENIISLDNLNKREHSWVEYVSGCLWALKQHQHSLTGFDCVITGNIPVGAGLSSSAALEMAVLKAASWCSDITLNKAEMARIGQYAENEWVGMNCGIMDQLISSAGLSGHALLIDCEDLSLQNCPIPKNTSIIVLDTTTRRGLVDSAYNERRTQCFNAAAKMGVDFLRNANLAMLEEQASNMNTLEYQRAKHVISENQRVKEAAECMLSNDFTGLGKLMAQSHISLRDDFEVSSYALNVIVQSAMESPACFGARMTGAGFGGCAVALVEKGQESIFIESVKTSYLKQTRLESQVYLCQPSDGVTIREI